jgi:cell wall-associated NlpC family hydrolase
VKIVGYSVSPPSRNAPAALTRRQRPSPTLWAIAIVTGIACSFTVGCASSGAVPHPFPRPGVKGRESANAPKPDTGGASTTSSATNTAIVDAALALLGTPYRNGGSTPEGFDCSGFTQWVFARQGVSLPRETYQQYTQGAALDRTGLRSGDLLFFSDGGNRPSHVAMAIDADRFIHAPSSRGVVRIEHLSSTYWSHRFLGARRIVTGP